MDPAIAKLAFKVAQPVLFAGFKTLRQEWARRRGDDDLLTGIAEIEDALEEAVEALAQDPKDLAAAARGLKALISRPDIFASGAPLDWIRTDLAQTTLKGAVRAAIRGEDDAPWAEAAILHYRSFLGGDEAHPDEGLVYAEALDFVLRSLRRDLTLGDRMILGAIEGVREEVVRMRPPDTGAIVDTHALARLHQIRRARFFRSSETQIEIAGLAEALISGSLRGASAGVRATILSWCTRLAAFTHDPRARLWLDHALALEAPASDALLVARAFVAAIDDGEAGLALLDVDKSPLQATATLQILRHTLGTEAALARGAAAGIDMAALDSDGRYVMLTSHVETGRWQDAARATALLVESDFEETPALLWVAASILVASRLPDDLRGLVLQSVPGNPAGFPLGDDTASLHARRLARTLIERAAAHCDLLELPREAGGARRYGLWLGLRDPDMASEAREQLRMRMREPGGDLAWLPLALGFGLEIDRDAAEHAIDKSLARHPDGSPETAGAMIALLIDHAERAPQKAIDLLGRHRAVFEAYLEAGSIVSLEIKVLADAGQTEAARALLAAQDEGTLPAHVRAMLSRAFDQEEPGDTIAALEAAYAKEEQITTLLALLRRYRQAGTPPRYVELARDLLGKVPDIEFAQDIIAHLSRLRRDAEALELVELLGDAVQRSAELLGEAAWLYYRRSQFGAAEAALAQLEAQRDDPNDRALRYQLLVTSGRWEALDGFIDVQWQRRDARTPLELAQCANLAAQTGAKRVAEFAFAAVAAAPDSPEVLVAAYSAMTSAGLEEDHPDAGGWIMRAADLSGESGPVQRKSIESLLDGQPEWEARVEEAVKAQAAAALPINMIGTMLSRPWLELQLAPLIANPQLADARKRSAVALASGRKRIDEEETLETRAIALDRTAIVTLAALDMLEPVLDAFDRIHVRHDLFRELFEQRNRLTFHQPSRITFAHRLTDLVTRGTVRAFQPSRVADLDLVADIGQGRAEMLGEAAGQDDGRHFFVHPFPIRRVGSLLSEPAPLERFTPQLVSCSGVVDALVRAGRLTKAQAAAAFGYLALHEERWPEEPRLAKGATLYLSDLAVSYFRYVGLLDRIVEAGLIPVVSQSELSQARALLDVEALSTEVDAVLKRARTAIQRASDEGRMVFDPLPASPSADQEDDKERDEDGDAEALSSLAACAPILISDDRFLNRHGFFEHDGQPTRILSSLDLAALLANSDRLDRARARDFPVALLRAGALFVPLGAADLTALIAETELDEGSAPDDADPHIFETGELRALRENIRLAQARGWFDPVTDTAWLVQLHNAIGTALLAQWRDGVPAELAQARADWLVRLLDTRGWADSLVRRNLDDLAAHGLVLDLAKLAGLCDQLDGEARASYEDWLETRVIGPALAREPLSRPILENHLRGLVRNVGQDLVHRDEKIDPVRAARFVFDGLPGFLQLGMLGDESFQDVVGYAVESTMQVGSASFTRQAVLDAATAIYADPARAQPVTDEKGRSWQLTTEPDQAWHLRFHDGETGYRVRGLIGLHPDADSRIAMLDAVLAEQDIAPEALSEWRARLLDRRLDASEIEDLDIAIRAFPPMVSQMIIDTFNEGGIAPSGLVPRERDYYRRLVGTSDAATLQDFLTDPARGALDWLAGDAIERAAFLLLRAARPGIVEESQFGPLTPEAWRALTTWALAHGDLFAKAGLAEIAMPRAQDDPELEQFVIAVAREIEALDPTDTAGPLHLLSCLAIFADGELSLQGTLSDWPPYRRRLAALAQASLIARVVSGQIDTKRFADFCAQERGWRFVAQNLSDLRLEPRWRPDLIAAEQLRHELLGRLANAAFALDEGQLTPGLAAWFTAAKDSLRTRLEVPMVFWPGPLEGGIGTVLRPPPDEMLAAIEEGLNQETLELEAVRRIVNIETMFTVPDALAERAATRIREIGPRLLASLATEQVSPFLLGLAHFAAARRMTALADTVQVMARYHRERAPVPMREEMQLALYAAAAREDRAAWRDKLGSWTLELAGRVEDEEEAEALLGWIDTLGDIDPGLRTRTGRARANLNLVLRR
jgi:hypothetical protein